VFFDIHQEKIIGLKYAPMVFLTLIWSETFFPLVFGHIPVIQ